MVSPVSLITGIFLLVGFAGLVMIATLLAVFLQSPISEGGYGYTPLQNANFTFAEWGGDVFAMLYVFFLQDKIPLWVCRHRGGGVWKPEYRLVLLIPSTIVSCIGLGIFGWALQGHRSIAVLVVATIMIFFGGVSFVPILNNYLAEAFTHHPIHAAVALNFYRLPLGLIVPFFITPWSARVGPGWVFGMMAFFTLFVALVISSLAFWGHEIRGCTFKRLQRSEEGEILKQP